MYNYDLNKTFYLIAHYDLTGFKGFVKIGDNKEEIIELFEDKYMWREDSFGVTEYTYKLYEVNAKEIMTDRDYLDKKRLNNE